jgi:hypothetical protein
MNKHPADELNEDLAANRLFGERAWNPLEQEPLVSHNPERIGQMLPLELPWLDEHQGEAEGAHSGTQGLMGGFWWLALGIGLGALIGMRLLGVIGLFAGAVFGASMASRFSGPR